MIVAKMLFIFSFVLLVVTCFVLVLALLVIGLIDIINMLLNFRHDFNPFWMVDWIDCCLGRIYTIGEL